MCELLNRIWSRPRGEWTRVVRRELPALAAEIVEELLQGIPGFSTLVDGNDAVDDDLIRQRVEEALLTALGYRDEPARDGAVGEDKDVLGARLDGGPDGGHGAGLDGGLDVRHDGRREEPHGGAPEAVRGAGHEHGPGHGDGHGHGHGIRHETAATAPDRVRQELFKALTDDRAASQDSLDDLARSAGWPLPAAVRAVALATPGEAQQLAAVLDDALAGMFAGRPCLLLPSPDADARAALDPLLRGRFAAVGHAVPLRDTASSLRWALRLLTLTPARGGLDARAVFVDDHLSTLLLLQDEPLAHALAARWLRPLADLTPRQSERLEVTLLAWLEGGGAPEAAKALNVHPQTVRYRMRQLEKLFGPGLRDPRTRFELEMALRSRRLMAQVRRQHSRVARRAARVVGADFPPLAVGRMARVNGL
ncbi:PucR family transcriptional regulator [Streptomyces katrae]|uniref:Regulatory protein n=1 Tax=Streptomyces katrae TaxID=68223 RepID=A0A0F4IQG5_9ACTN|nr:PucR family transcriptional regulator [Streptomyces katrae]KJY24237.1 regulatory protein [Streptomyces katrae]